MRPPLRPKAWLWLTLVGAAWGATTASWWPLGLLLLLLLVPLAADFVWARFFPWVVYQLHDDQHQVIYVGQTNNVARRMREHVDGIEHEWWRDVYGYTIVRHCASERQSERIERRRIAVLNRCADKAYCDLLRNEQHAERHRQPGVVATLWWWKWMYLFGSLVFDSCTFHAPAEFTIRVPRRRVDEEDEWWVGPEPAVNDEPITAFYPRSESPQSGSLTMLALPPARNADRNENDRNDPYTGRSPVNDPDDRYVTPDTDREPRTIGERIRATNRDRQTAILTDTADQPPPTSPRSRQPLSNAERQRRYRERRRQDRQR